MSHLTFTYLQAPIFSCLRETLAHTTLRAPGTGLISEVIAFMSDQDWQAWPPGLQLVVHDHLAAAPSDSQRDINT